MKPKKIAIIGAGMGGLAAGIYGQINGYDTMIYEMHTRPGGQCASWKRKGYTFDACIHHFFGCRNGSSINRLWQEVGVMPRQLIKMEECTAVLSPEGKLFTDYYDLKQLRDILQQLSPADSKLIVEYIRSIEAFSKRNLSDMMLDRSLRSISNTLPVLLMVRKWSNTSMGKHAEDFDDPFLRRAFGLLMYSNPQIPVFMHMLWQAGGLSGEIQWPVGGAGQLVQSMEKRYRDLGGNINFSTKVKKILVENGKAVGITLSDGNHHAADIVISNADGRRTIFDMLDGKYINETVLSYCRPITDDTPFAISVFLGVNRDLSREPSSLIMLLDKPVNMANRDYDSIEAQIYGYDKTMAPPGKGTIKVELSSSYSYWKQLYNDREGYKLEKQRIGQQIIKLLENYFHGITTQVEVIDVVTLMTWERFMGGSQGWFNLPNRKFDTSIYSDHEDKQYKTTLPGLDNFYFVGTWATMMSSLFNNAYSGKAAIRHICKKDGHKFKVAR